jgi:Tol biopolymer transport system component
VSRVAVQSTRTALAAAGFALYLVAGQTEPFVTVPQRDDGRLFAGPATADISSDGRFVAFESLAALVPADTDPRRDVYVLNRITGQVTLESAMVEPWANAAHPRLSRDGRMLVFEIETLVDGEHQLRVNLLVRDRSTGVHVTLQAADGSRPPDGATYSPDISDDGRVVTFSSSATNLVAGPDLNGALEDVYVFDVESKAVRRVSVDSNGQQLASGLSYSPSVSADGRFIAFGSTATLTPAALRLSAGQPRAHLRQVYLRDEMLRTTTLVSAAGDRWPDGPSIMPAISGDGRYVAFASQASNLIRGDRNSQSDIFLHDRDAGATILVTRAANGGSANGGSARPAISFDGRFVAFQSDASNLVCTRRCPSRGQDLNLLWDVFVADWRGGSIRRTSEDHLGGWMEPSIGPALDADGTLVVFSSRHPVDGTDATNDFDLFVRTVVEPQQITAQRPGRQR